jgi:hypothetical protein
MNAHPIRAVTWRLLLSLCLVAAPLADAVAAQRGGIPLQPMQAGFCSAVAPTGWQVTATDPKGTVIELSDGAFSAFYNIIGVDGMSQQTLPGFGHPAMIVHSTMAAGFRGDPFVSVTPPTVLGDMYVQEFDSARWHGVALYRVYPMAMGGYVLIQRIALGPRELWSAYGPVAVSIASSTRCRAQLMPSGDPGGSHSRGSSESTYNAQLGTEYAHDPETGQLFLMQHGSDWQESGPDGPGYYRERAGGGQVKLTPGMP